MSDKTITRAEYETCRLLAARAGGRFVLNEDTRIVDDAPSSEATMTDDDVKRVTFLLSDLLVNDDLATEDMARAAMAETLRIAGERLRLISQAPARTAEGRRMMRHMGEREAARRFNAATPSPEPPASPRTP